MSEENEQLKRILEVALLAAGEALTVERMQTLFEEESMPEKDTIREALSEIKASCEGRGFDLIEVASGYRFQVREDVASWINRLWEEKPQKYSRAMLETLALIAYRQPITRGDIEEVRGVAVSSHIIKTLSEREWIKVVGHRDVPGRPSLYATTKSFLDYFNLKSLEELPTLGELKDIDGLNKALDFEEGAAPQQGESGKQGESAEDSPQKVEGGEGANLEEEASTEKSPEENLPDEPEGEGSSDSPSLEANEENDELQSSLDAGDDSELDVGAEPVEVLEEAAMGEGHMENSDIDPLDQTEEYISDGDDLSSEPEGETDYVGEESIESVEKDVETSLDEAETNDGEQQND